MSNGIVMECDLLVTSGDNIIWLSAPVVTE